MARVTAAYPRRDERASVIEDACKGRGWSLHDLAGEIQKVRAARGHRPVGSRENLRRQIIGIQRGGPFGAMWRADLAAAFRADPEALFGPIIDTNLPRPLLLHMPVDGDVLDIIANRPTRQN